MYQVPQTVPSSRLIGQVMDGIQRGDIAAVDLCVIIPTRIGVMEASLVVIGRRCTRGIIPVDIALVALCVIIPIERNVKTASSVAIGKSTTDERRLRRNLVSDYFQHT